MCLQKHTKGVNLVSSYKEKRNNVCPSTSSEPALSEANGVSGIGTPALNVRDYGAARGEPVEPSGGEYKESVILRQLRVSGTDSYGDLFNHGLSLSFS